MTPITAAALETVSAGASLTENVANGFLTGGFLGATVCGTLGWKAGSATEGGGGGIEGAILGGVLCGIGGAALGTAGGFLTTVHDELDPPRSADP